MSSRFKSPPLSLFVGRHALELGLRRWRGRAGGWETREEVAKDFISLSVESLFIAKATGRRDRGGGGGISWSLCKRKVVKGRLCVKAKESTLRLHLSTQRLWRWPCVQTGAFRFPQVTASSVGNRPKESKTTDCLSN